MFQYISSGLKFILVLLIALILAGAINPVTGKRQLILLSESDEIQLWKMKAKPMSCEYNFFTSPALMQLRLPTFFTP